MRIGLLSPGSLPLPPAPCTSVEIYTANLARELSHHHPVTLYARGAEHHVRVHGNLTTRTWKTRGGTSLQTRGLGMWHNYIYFELHDDWVVCLDARNGKEVWKKEIASFDQQYFSSVAPIVVGDHVLAGTGNDMDADVAGAAHQIVHDRAVDDLEPARAR